MFHGRPRRRDLALPLWLVGTYQPPQDRYAETVADPDPHRALTVD
jgi:hypothetical protein